MRRLTSTESLTDLRGSPAGEVIADPEKRLAPKPEHPAELRRPP